MNKKIKALDSIKDSYDAFYIANKYGDNGTHDKEFELLSELKGELVPKALGWIKHQYDCYYKDKYKDESGSAFEYLRNLILAEED